MELISEILGTRNAKTIVIFGGNPSRRVEVLQHIASIGDITAYGTLSEGEGIKKLEELNDKVDLVVIGGAYTIAQRGRIKSWINEHIPNVKISQPGFDYAYSNESIVNDIKSQLKL